MRLIQCLLLAFALAANLGIRDGKANYILPYEPDFPKRLYTSENESMAVIKSENGKYPSWKKDFPNQMLGCFLAGISVGHMIEYRKPSRFILGCVLLLFSTISSFRSFRS